MAESSTGDGHPKITAGTGKDILTAILINSNASVSVCQDKGSWISAQEPGYSQDGLQKPDVMQPALIYLKIKYQRQFAFPKNKNSMWNGLSVLQRI
jgi:hypothetical protein